MLCPYLYLLKRLKTTVKLHLVEYLCNIFQITRPLDRELQDRYTLLVKATEECLKTPQPQSFFNEDDDTLLKVIIQVKDVNDNAPKFIHRVFTGGVSTATSFGTKFMHVQAEDADIDENAIISYYQVGRIQMTLTEGLDHLQRPPFSVDRESGAIQLNFDPQRGMKGYFDFMVNESFKHY